MSDHIIITPLDDGSTRAVDAHGNVWLFDLESTHELYSIVPEQSGHRECGSGELVMADTIMGEHIEN